MKPTPEKYLRDLLEHTSLIAYLKYVDGKYIYVNKLYEVAAQTPAKKILGRYDRDIFPEPVARLFREQDEQVIAKKAPIEFEETIPLMGTVMSFITSKFPLFATDGKVWAVGGVCTNVTALKKTQEELLKSQGRFQAIIENSIEGIVIVDTAGVIRYSSPAFLDALGYRPDESAGRNIREFVHPDDLAPAMADLSEVAKDPKTMTSRELRVPHKDGSWRTIEGRAVNRLDNPHIRGILINFRDVTARRIVEDHLIDSERRYRALVETTNTGFVIVDGEGKVIDANAEYVRLTGNRDLEEIRGRSVVEWTAPHEKERNAKAVADCFKNGSIRDFEVEYVNRQGDITPIEVTATVVKMGDKPLIMTLCRDITERRKAAEELRLHREITTRMSEGILLATADKQKIVYANPKAEEMFGLEPGQMTGKDIRKFRNPDTTLPGSKIEDIVEALRKNGQWQGEVANIKRDGTPFWSQTNISAFAHPVFGPVFLSVHTDITKRKEAEEALQNSKARLEEAERLAGIGSIQRDFATNTTFRSEGFHRIYGATLEELGNQPEAFLRFVHEDDRARVQETLRRNITENAPFQDTYRIRRPDGAVRIVQVESTVRKDQQGRPVGRFAWIQDITERRVLEEKVLNISDRERRNIGHDLHDDIGQQLTGISLLGRALQDRLAAQSSPEADSMTELLSHVDHTLARVREMSRGLETVPPRPEGLLEALSGLAHQISAAAQLSCRLKAGRSILVDSPHVANHLYRIAQEAVNNAVRHGRPKAVTISLTQQEEGLTLTVADDGAGLLESSRKGPGMGLDIMRHRASLIHGTLTISSHTGGGTEVTCRVPAGTPANGGER